MGSGVHNVLRVEIYGAFGFLFLPERRRNGKRQCASSEGKRLTSMPNIQRRMRSAGGGARTHTALRPLDFESSASANSATPAT